MCERVGKIISMMLCFMHQSIIRPIYIFNNDAYFLDFRAQKFALTFFNLNPFQHHQALHFGVLNYEKQHKEGTCKVSGRSVVFSSFYADFCFCSKSVIITTLMFTKVRYKMYETYAKILGLCICIFFYKKNAKIQTAVSISREMDTAACIFSFFYLADTYINANAALRRYNNVDIEFL